MKRSNGFTLIELMICVAIIGVLAAIAFPSYMASVRKSHRTDATVALNDIATKLQRCYTTYSKFDTENTKCPVKDTVIKSTGINSTNKYYLVVGTDFTATKFKLTATPITGTTQAADNECVEFTLDQTGKKSAKNSSGNDTSDTCW